MSLGDSYEGTVLVEDVKAKTWEALKSRAELAKCLLEEQVEKPDVENAEAEIQKLKDVLIDRYEAFADGKITKEDFIRFRDENKVQTAKLEQELSLLKGKEEYLVRRKEALVPLAKIAGESEMTREMLLKVVDVVYWQDGEVKLKLKADEFLGE